MGFNLFSAAVLSMYHFSIFSKFVLKKHVPNLFDRDVQSEKSGNGLNVNL